jgi:hypothetical protein
MKHYILLTSIIIPTISFAMEPYSAPSFAESFGGHGEATKGEPEIEIRNRELDTLNKPHITIINKLPKDLGFSTRIDISDKTKTDRYTKNSYRPDDSTKTIYSGQGIRFSPWLNKNGEPEHKRLGMNDAGDAALIALYIHGTIDKWPLFYLMIGKGAIIRFGDTITFHTNSDDAITLNHNDREFWKLETKEKINVINETTMSLLKKYSRSCTTTAPTSQPDAPSPVPLIGGEVGDLFKFLRENPQYPVLEMQQLDTK